MNGNNCTWYPSQKGARYYNPIPGHMPESILFGTLPSLIFSLLRQWHRKSFNSALWQQEESIIARSTKPLITWIGHATFLIQCAGKNILTDPVFFDISRLFRRLLPPGIMLDALPPIDYVLISHNHWDHVDLYSLQQLQKRNKDLQILVPIGDKAWFTRQGFAQVTEHTWWQQSVHSDITFTFLPALHWSGRGLFDTNKSLWGSWMMGAADATLYFGGDTAFGNHFEQIAREFPNIDCALLPIGPCEPHAWMQRMHMNSKQAVKAFAVLNARHFIPMHWGTFPFGYDQFDEPIQQLLQAWKLQESSSEKQLQVLKIGQRAELNPASAPAVNFSTRNFQSMPFIYSDFGK